MTQFLTVYLQFVSSASVSIPENKLNICTSSLQLLYPQVEQCRVGEEVSATNRKSVWTVLFWWLSLLSHLTLALPLLNLPKCSLLPSAYSWTKITQYRTGQRRNNGKLSFVAFRALVQSRAGRDCNLFYCDHFLAKMQNKTGFNFVFTGQIHAPCVGKGVASMFKKMLQTC